jgi:hypothetical protein
MAIVVTLLMLLTMSTAGIAFAKGGTAGPSGPGAGSSSGGSSSGAGASGGDAGGAAGGGDGAGVGGGVGAVRGVGGGGARTSKFLTAPQEYTLDTFNACARGYAGAMIDGLSPDGGFSFSSRYRSDANGIKDCMAKKGFRFSW